MRLHVPRKLRRSLNTLLGSIAGTIFFLFMAITTCTSFFADQQSIRDNLRRTADDVVNRLQESLARPLWSFDFQTMVLVMQGEARSPDLAWITLQDEHERVQVHVKKNLDGSLRSFTGNPGTELSQTKPFIRVSRLIAHEGQTIGTVWVAVSDEPQQKESFARIVGSTFTQLLMSLLAIAWIVVSVRFFIIKRLNDLGNTVSEFAKTGFATRANVAQPDEIGKLAKQFNHMAHTISEYSSHMEELVQERTRQLVESEKLAFLGSLVAGISHEINTPVGVCLTATTYLQNRLSEISTAYRSGELSKTRFDRFMEELEKSTAMIVTNLERTGELVRNFRGIGADQLKDEKRLFNLKEQLNEVIFTLGPKFKGTSHTITCNCPETLVIDSYPSAFNQIISNLVMNSLIHGFSETKPGLISIDVQKDDFTLLIRYRDNGIGINAEVLPQIFNLFFTTRHGQGGTGLGLYIVQSLIHKMGGSVGCTSEPEKGVEFTIYLPLSGIAVRA